MRAQAAIEFLTTYGFVFMALGLAIVIIVFLSSYTGSVSNTQCSSFDNLNCVYIGFYSNTSYSKSLLYFVLQNAAPNPVTMNGISAQFGGTSARGACAPTFLYPGQTSTCMVAFNSLPSSISVRDGDYEVNSTYCDSSIASFNAMSCVPTNAIYAGTFQVYGEGNDTLPFSVIVAQPPSTTALPAYPSSPQIPPNYTIIQNGYIVPARNLSSFWYALGSFQYSSSATTYFHAAVHASAFPSTVSDLTTNAIACTQPYNSLVSIAYSVFYLPTTSNIMFQSYADNAIEIFYKANTTNTWSHVYGNVLGWPTSSPSASITNSVTLGANTYQIGVEWVNTCAEALEAVSVNGIGR